jgi:toxin ParE1/3/4
MGRILRTAAARDDYFEIYDYIAEHSLQNAERVLRRLDERLRLLAANNLMGRPRPELAANLRSFPESSYIIFYRPIDGGIELIRVIHSARDITPEFFD